MSKKYYVLSPDGIPISPHPCTSMKSAVSALNKFCASYVFQGYYSTVTSGSRLHIPVDKIWEYCQIETETEVVWSGDTEEPTVPPGYMAPRLTTECIRELQLI